MARESKRAIEELSALIAQIKAGAYARGRADARKEVLDLLRAGGRAAPAGRGKRSGATPPKRRAGRRKRAPRGSVPRFVERALAERPGSTVRDILDLAAADAERPISPSSIRVELRKGLGQGRYVSSDGRWSLAGPASREAGGERPPDTPPEPERNEVEDAPARNPAAPEDSAREPEADGNAGRLGLNW